MVSKYKLASDWDGQDVQTRYIAQPSSPPKVIETLSTQRRREEKENFNIFLLKLRNIAFITCMAVLGIVIMGKFFNSSSSQQLSPDNQTVVNQQDSTENIRSENVKIEQNKKHDAVKNNVAATTRAIKKTVKNSQEYSKNKEEESVSVASNKNNSTAEDKELYQTMDQLKGLTK